MNLDQLKQISDQQMKVTDFRTTLSERADASRMRWLDMEMKIQKHKQDMIKLSVENAERIERYNQLLQARRTFYRFARELRNKRNYLEKKLEKVLGRIDKIEALFMGSDINYRRLPMIWTAFIRLLPAKHIAFPETDGSCFTKNKNPDMKIGPTGPSSIHKIAGMCSKNSYTLKVDSPEFLILVEAIDGCMKKADVEISILEEKMVQAQAELKATLAGTWTKLGISQ